MLNTDVKLLVEEPKAAVQEAAKAEIERPAAGLRYPLGLARFMASSHVVLGHLYARGVIPHYYFFGWGFTWVCLGNRD